MDFRQLVEESHVWIKWKTNKNWNQERKWGWNPCTHNWRTPHLPNPFSPILSPSMRTASSSGSIHWTASGAIPSCIEQHRPRSLGLRFRRGHPNHVEVLPPHSNDHFRTPSSRGGRKSDRRTVDTVAVTFHPVHCHGRLALFDLETSAQASGKSDTCVDC